MPHAFAPSAAARYSTVPENRSQPWPASCANQPSRAATGTPSSWTNTASRCPRDIWAPLIRTTRPPAPPTEPITTASTAFLNTPEGCKSRTEPQPAQTVGANRATSPVRAYGIMTAAKAASACLPHSVPSSGNSHAHSSSTSPSPKRMASSREKNSPSSSSEILILSASLCAIASRRS